MQFAAPMAAPCFFLGSRAQPLPNGSTPCRGQDKERQSQEHEEERKRLEQEATHRELRPLQNAFGSGFLFSLGKAQRNMERLNEERKRRLRLLEEKARRGHVMNVGLSKLPETAKQGDLELTVQAVIRHPFFELSLSLSHSLSLFLFQST